MSVESGSPLGDAEKERLQQLAEASHQDLGTRSSLADAVIGLGAQAAEAARKTAADKIKTVFKA
jgi:hypothetical protein